MLSLLNVKTELLSIPVEQFGKKDKFYKAIVCFAKFLIAEEMLDESFTQKLQKYRPKRHTSPKRLSVTESDVKRLLDSTESSLEHLIVTLLSSTGLRASEACALDIGDIDLTAQVLTVRRGKGGKSRRVGLTPKTIEAITFYLAERSFHDETSPLLLNSNALRMDRHGLRQRLERLGKLAGVEVSPHALRRSFVTVNVNKGRPLVHLQIACGHSDIKTTRSYCQTSEDEVIESMKNWN